MFSDELEKQINKYSQWLAKAESECKVLPSGRLRISNSKGITRYYLIDGKDSTYGHYIHKNSDLPKAIAQRQYYEQTIPILCQIVYQLKQVKSSIKKDKLSNYYSNLVSDRKKLIQPYELPIDEFIKRWESKVYVSKGFDEHSITYTTNRGEKVRSKSEVIIANLFDLFKVPYRYEYPLVTRYGKIMYPDFTVLNKRTRKEFLFEHFGMMDNKEYSDLFCFKLKSYQDEGFFPGINLLFTTETSKVPLDTEILKELIKKFLL